MGASRRGIPPRRSPSCTMRALFTTLPGIGHLHAMVPMARALTQAGHEVAFATSLRFSAAIEASGFPSFPCGFDWLEAEFSLSFPELRAAPIDSEQTQRRVMNILADGLARQMATDVQALIRVWKPAIVVRDLLEFGGCLAAESLGVPHASCGPLFYPDPVHLKRSVGDALGRLRRMLGLPFDPSLRMLFRYLDLTFAAPSYLGGPQAVSAVSHFLQPALFDESGDERLPAWIDELPDRPTVVATLGTVFNGIPALFETVLDALGGGPFNLILTVGRNRDPAEFTPLPANTRVVRYIPYTLLLPHCDLVITHGGSTTVTACLMEGLPLLVIPVAGDHFATAKRCVRAGVGIALGPETCTARGIRRAATQLLADSWHRDNARRLRQEMLALPTLAHGVELLEQLASTGSPRTTGRAE
jgi:UDP:flavonoid glycosyltransferase YjiC (YdhE family)